jgi:hypothetical protein
MIRAVLKGDVIRTGLRELSRRVLAKGGLSVVDIAGHLTQHDVVLRQIRDDCRLGPPGFVDERATYYLGAEETMWTCAFAVVAGR